MPRCVTVNCSVLQCVAETRRSSETMPRYVFWVRVCGGMHLGCSMLQRVAACCSVLQCVAVCFGYACSTSVGKHMCSLLHVCDTTHLYVWHDSFIGVTMTRKGGADRGGGQRGKRPILKLDLLRKLAALLLHLLHTYTSESWVMSHTHYSRHTRSESWLRSFGILLSTHLHAP